MSKFYYIVRDQSGHKTSGVEDAGTQEEAISKLQAKGFIVISVIAERKEEIPVLKEEAAKIKFKPKHNSITSEDLVLFCRQIATLLGAGVTILKSLEIISMQVSSYQLNKVLQDLKKRMESGLSFHEAMAKHPRVFSDLWINLVESGEASGNLAVVLSRLATYLERNAAFKAKIISALVYPTLLTVAGIGALLFMTIKIIPTFAQVFSGFNIELPPLTKFLLFVSNFLRSKFILLIVIFAAAGYFFRRYIRTENGRRKWENFLFKLPNAGEFFRAITMERFSSEMSTLLESGVPILYSLEIAEHSVGNLVVADIIRKIKDGVREGKTLREPLEKSGFFDPMLVQMVSIGEEIGELPQMFKKINVFYQEYTETYLTRFVSMFEPIILLVMGTAIGVMVIGMFLPIFQIAKIGG
ncbi:MAG: type II secretion system F family protein [Candidatus Omnitrophica bacterium]|nr:type II secretion system F family protein [Candidatus Omnitrophota bacterium]